MSRKDSILASLTLTKCNEFEILTNQVGVLIHAGIVEDTAKAQIDIMAKHPSFWGKIAIMPDVHAGKGCVVGFTGKFRKSVIPSVVGVDIGCGVVTYRLKSTEIDFVWLDRVIREIIPLGFGSRPKHKAITGIEDVFTYEAKTVIDICDRAGKLLVDLNLEKDMHKPHIQMGTLGGGNHFIEIEKGVDGQLYLTIHTGSRNFGLKIANYHQKKAKLLMEEMNIHVPEDMEYLPMSSGGNEYIKDMKLAQEYAHYNRIAILKAILQRLNEEYDFERLIESVHNYISDRDGVIRKGAISAHKTERLVIPLNMGAGIVLGIGKGNEDYNNSAPHGAGRLYGRKDLMRKLASGTFHSMDDYRNAMTGIYTTSVTEKTFDESPFAYKSYESLMPHLTETVEIIEVIKPVYNLKASEEIERHRNDNGHREKKGE